ncbi:hypothetical protein FBU30_007870 [Linnemannia zychae]|nr:hypothetical protein FBU30_007870 [Linnemannia zychae]
MDSLGWEVLEEKKAQKEGQRHLLSTYWSKLGGDKVEKQRFIENLYILKDMERTTDRAKNHVESIHEKFSKYIERLGILHGNLMDSSIPGEMKPGSTEILGLIKHQILSIEMSRAALLDGAFHQRFTNND